MRVLITNSLVLAAISLAPSASAAPFTTSSSVDSYDSYPNSTLAQDSGSSSVPSMLYPYGRTITLSRPTSPLDVRRDEVIDAEPPYDESSFGGSFRSIADLFNSMGMDAGPDKTSPAEVPKTVLDQLHGAPSDKVGTVLAPLPADLPVSPPSPRSLEDRQIPDPLALLGSLPLLGNIILPVKDLITSMRLGAGPVTDTQKQLFDKLQTEIKNVVGGVAAKVPVDVLPFGHQSRSVEERSLEGVSPPISPPISPPVGSVPALSSVLSPIAALLGSLGPTDGSPMNEAQKLVLSRLQNPIAEVVKNFKDRVPSVHIEHARGEAENWAQDRHNDPHKDDHRSHDAHGDRKDGPGPQDVREDGHRSPDVRKEDRDAQRTDRGGNRCREPRDGQRDERDRWDDWRHHGDGKGRDEDSSLLKINLGHSCRP